mgnify:FL=1
MDELVAHLASMKLEELQDAPPGLVDLVVDKTRSTILTTSDLKAASPECQTQFIAEFVLNTPKMDYEDVKNLVRFAEFGEKIGCRAPTPVIDFFLKTATFEVSLDNGKKAVFHAEKATAHTNVGQNDSKNAMFKATVKIPLYDLTPEAELVKAVEAVANRHGMENLQVTQKKDSISGANTLSYSLKFTPGQDFNFFGCAALTKIDLPSGNAARAHFDPSLSQYYGGCGFCFKPTSHCSCKAREEEYRKRKDSAGKHGAAQRIRAKALKAAAERKDA